MKVILNKYMSFICLVLFSIQVAFNYASSMDFINELPCIDVQLSLLYFSESSDLHSNTQNQEESEESEESEEEVEKELEVIKATESIPGILTGMDKMIYSYLLKASKGCFQEQFSPPECRV